MRLALFMSGSGTNAREIIKHAVAMGSDAPYQPVLLFTDNSKAYSNASRMSTTVAYPAGIDMGVQHMSWKAFKRYRGEELGKETRRDYNQAQAVLLQQQGVDAVALAGWNWLVTEPIYDGFVTVNVHPADLRRRDERGNPLYAGLGWVPSAKAILNGDDEVRSSVHVVAKEVDKGPVLSVSQPVAVPEDVREMDLAERTSLLMATRDVRDYARMVRAAKKKGMEEEELRAEFPLYAYASDCQAALLRPGDWTIFPKTLEWLAQGRLALDEQHVVHFDEKPKPEGIEFPRGDG